ncbi:MAG: sensor histidine kinase, partial [Calditrichaeota bacterium]
DEIDTLDKSEIRECVRDMHSSASNLLNLLDNLLTWSLIHGEGVAFQPTRFDLSEVISHVLDVFRSSAEKKAITLECRGEQPLEVTADRNMLNSVLQNLVSNAVKFTDSGGRVVVEARKSDHGFELTVTDTGVGISQEDLPHLFEKDARRSTPGTAKEKGNGLGLSLVREFVERHGGDIVVESEAGKGTTFKIQVPTSLPHHNQEPKTPERSSLQGQA